MTVGIRRDRLREFVDLIIGSLDEDTDGTALAQRAFLSRFHFDRLVSAALGESPTAFRRSLLLERAAWRLIRDPAIGVSAIAAEAGYTKGALDKTEKEVGTPSAMYSLIRGEKLRPRSTLTTAAGVDSKVVSLTKWMDLLRETPEFDGNILWRAAPGVVGRISKCAGGWCWFDVGGKAGYVEETHLWGVDPGEQLD